MSDSVVVEREDAVAWIVLNRPDVLNAFNEEMGGAFVGALEASRDPAVRCVVVIGRGKAFCAGEDLRALSGDYAAGGAPDLGGILRRRYIPAVETIQSLDKPVVAAVNGVAAGAGVSIALACDYRVMAEEASYMLAFSRVGLIPDAGGTWLLPKYLGVGRALEIALLSTPIPAARALELGLANRICPAADVRSIAAEVAGGFAAGPTVAYGLMKKLIWKAAGRHLGEHLAAEADAQTAAGKSADHLEGVKAFLEKREPRFEGR